MYKSACIYGARIMKGLYNYLGATAGQARVDSEPDPEPMEREKCLSLQGELTALLYVVSSD